MNHNETHVFDMQILIQGGIIFFWCLCLIALSVIYLPNKLRLLVQARLVLAHIIAVALEYGLAAITVFFPRNDVIWSALFLGAIVSLLIASATSYMVFLRRLKRTFQSSFCEITPCLYFGHIVLLTCCVISQCVGMMFIAGLFDSQPTLTMVCLLGSFLLMAFGTVHILTVFNVNLFKVMKMEQRVKPCKTKTLVCDPHIVEVATKQTLLSTVPVLVTLITFPVAGMTMPFFGAFVCYIATFWALGVVVMVTALCHLLSFGEFDPLYKKSCHFSHVCVQRCCQRRIQHQMQDVVSQVNLQLEQRDSHTVSSDIQIITVDGPLPNTADTAVDEPTVEHE
eukprot:CAMPEP_0202713432 /NCGR_PEP_ID=MMETSP1385-20130828/53863_1 /ASSEMBLY_ACC=CAM_ASM_000861 /TAXON_ID=933848 /ORGANISM="Elphidium margaritaceum" /LENGTH=337 /DNA_ID=CAMNT_0049373781 /DNA_START=35 /DNA_END=1048 /DNA_ORIENTATION=+